MSNTPYLDLSCKACALPECGGLPCTGYSLGPAGDDSAHNCVHNIGVCLEAVRRDRMLANKVAAYVHAQETCGNDPRTLGLAVQGLIGTVWDVELTLGG